MSGIEGKHIAACIVAACGCIAGVLMGDGVIVGLAVFFASLVAVDE